MLRMIGRNAAVLDGGLAVWTGELMEGPGNVPEPARRPEGCIFASRCPANHHRCSEKPPRRQNASGHAFACWLEAACWRHPV